MSHSKKQVMDAQQLRDIQQEHANNKDFEFAFIVPHAYQRMQERGIIIKDAHMCSREVGCVKSVRRPLEMFIDIKLAAKHLTLRIERFVLYLLNLTPTQR